MSVADEPGGSATRPPSERRGHVHIVMCNGLEEVHIGEHHLPVGSYLELHRDGEWHPARVSLCWHLGVKVEVLSPTWPGAPCVFDPEDYELIAARPKVD